MTEGNAVRWMLGVIAIFMLATATGGCADTESLRAFRGEASALHEALRADADRWEEQAAQVPPDDPTRPQVLAEAAGARARQQLVASGLARIDEVLAEASNPTDPLSETVGAAAPLLPISLRGPLVLGAAALVTALRAWRLKAGLSSVARGLAAAMREDEEFRACFTRHANTFRSTQTPTAKRVVDEVTSPKPLLALPI